MAHRQIVGMTESGKTTYAKVVCRELKKRGITTLVYDPMFDEWDATETFRDRDKFLVAVAKSRNATLFIDETSASIDRNDSECEFLATRSRHLGHNCYFIGQRLIHLSPTMRDQCKGIIVFTLPGLADRQAIVEGFNAPIAMSASDLPQLHFIMIERYKPNVKGYVDPVKQSIMIVREKQDGKTTARDGNTLRIANG